jgi:Protein of unknown function (DUF2475)
LLIWKFLNKFFQYKNSKYTEIHCLKGVMDINMSGMKHLPGYTGHIPSELDYEEGIGRSVARSHIPGYQGYIPSVKSENLYGETYGKTTFKSSVGEFPKGLDVEPKDKYRSVHRDQFINLYQVKEKTATEMLGVEGRKTQEPPLIPVETRNVFWGVDDPEIDFKRSLNAFYGEGKVPEQQTNVENDYATNTSKFFGREKKDKPIKNGEPIPGYTGYLRRVVADNIFGVTYAQSRKNALSEFKEQKSEKAEVLKDRAVFVPEYRR